MICIVSIKGHMGSCFFYHTRGQNIDRINMIFWGLGFSLNFQIQAQQTQLHFWCWCYTISRLFFASLLFSEDADFSPAIDFVFMAVDFTTSSRVIVWNTFPGQKYSGGLLSPPASWEWIGTRFRLFWVSWGHGWPDRTRALEAVVWKAGYIEEHESSAFIFANPLFWRMIFGFT